MKPEPMAVATGFDFAKICQITPEASAYGSGKMTFLSSQIRCAAFGFQRKVMNPFLNLLKTWAASNLLSNRSRDVLLYAVLAIATATMFLAYIARMHDVTHDAFHEMALAREWFLTGKFPTDDLFAYTPTVSPAVHHEWATGFALYWVSAMSPFGLDGIILLKLILIAILSVTLYRVARGNGAHPIVFFLLAPIVFPVLWVGFATLRAQLFTLVAIALTLLMLQSDWRGQRKWILFWIPLYVIWLNMHAGFVVGLGLMGFHSLERLLSIVKNEFHQVDSASNPNEGFLKSFQRVLLSKHLYRKAYEKLWHLFALAPIALCCLYLNPWGWQYVSYLIRAITMPRPLILEWQPIWFTYDPMTTLLTFGCSVLLIAYAATERRWDRLRGWLFCLLAAYMALKHIRHGSIYAVVWLAMVPAWITSTPFGRSLVRFVKDTRQNWMRFSSFAIAVSIGFALYQPFYRATIPVDVAPSSFGFPKGAVDYLESHQAQGNVMTPFHCGAYVSWRLYPAVKVSLDGRYEVAYQPQVMEQHRSFYEAATGWQDTLAAYQHDFVIVPKDAVVYESLRNKTVPTAGNWSCIYEDNYFALFSRVEVGT